MSIKVIVTCDQCGIETTVPESALPLHTAAGVPDEWVVLTDHDKLSFQFSSWECYLAWAEIHPEYEIHGTRYDEYSLYRNRPWKEDDK